MTLSIGRRGLLVIALGLAAMFAAASGALAADVRKFFEGPSGAGR